MTQITAYLAFEGNCRDAMTFYQQVFGGELTLSPVSESPMSKDMPAEKQQWIIHSELKGANFRLFGSDNLSPNPFTKGSATRLCVTGTKEEVTAQFNKLAEGAHVSSPLQEAFFGLYGDLTDKFDVSWMFQADLS